MFIIDFVAKFAFVIIVLALFLGLIVPLSRWGEETELPKKIVVVIGLIIISSASIGLNFNYSENPLLQTIVNSKNIHM
ncbi:hypothetical protein [Halalkalibacter alkalisediminis]|uniref:Uncharacterized protein n=1 Tax=Halalkalibacter alkalisediminis TaxID=935616 RepID=A0ABV6NJ70_9BACI|nr:hypothetical protein [Halalkalibacter alkalisediminis]